MEPMPEPNRDEVVKRFGQAAADLWMIARETPDLGPEQREALQAVVQLPRWFDFLREGLAGWLSLTWEQRSDQ